MAKPLSKYERFVADGGLAKVRIMKMNGLKDYEIQEQFKISRKTFWKWKADHPEFADALVAGLNEAINDAIKALVSKFKKSTVTETKVEEWTDGNNKKRTHVIKITREVVPDTTAIIFFLKAKAGWRDNAEIVDTSALKKLDELLNQTQEIAEQTEDEETDEVLEEAD